MERVYIHEVMPRDGLQNEPSFVSTEDKIRLIDRLSRTGVSKIEVTSFVSPKRVPNLRDAEEVMKGIQRVPGVCYTALVPNVKGAERALDCGVDEINVVISISETHNRKNVGCSVEESLDRLGKIVDLTGATSVTVNCTLGTAFGCPYEGKIAESRLLSIVAKCVEQGVGGISLADTTGMANPRQVYRVCQRVRDAVPDLPLTLHFHNTRGMGLANVLEGLRAGVVRYDASLGGIGGCPFAPGASGNICTEDLVHMLQSMGYEVPVDLDALIRVARELQEILARELPGQVIKAGKTTDLHPA